MALLKLGLVKRKVLLFVNAVEDAYRLRLFLESFGIRSAAISAELPMNSRHHILQVPGSRACMRHLLNLVKHSPAADGEHMPVQEFNRGIFDYLIATDQPGKYSQGKKGADSEQGRKGTKRRRTDADDEFGVTRGVDFKGVETVLNVDAPLSVSRLVFQALAIR